MVAFAGRKYAARSQPAFVANGTYTVTSFTLVRSVPRRFSLVLQSFEFHHLLRDWFPILFQVLEFKKGRLQNLYWKRDGCSLCAAKSSTFVCLNNQDCAIKTSSCKNKGGTVDCSLGIQLAFSGTDKHLSALNSWYEVEKLRQYSLYGLYSNLKDSLTSQYNKILWSSYPYPVHSAIYVCSFNLFDFILLSEFLSCNRYYVSMKLLFCNLSKQLPKAWQ